MVRDDNFLYWPTSTCCEPHSEESYVTDFYLTNSHLTDCSYRIIALDSDGH